MVFIWFYFLVFLFKQKTAYEMRISDWSSDVCSSDLKLDLALEVQFLRGLISRIDAPAGAQGLEPRLVQRKTRRLPFLAVGHEPEPAQIAPDRDRKSVV